MYWFYIGNTICKLAFSDKKKLLVNRNVSKLRIMIVIQLKKEIDVQQIVEMLNPGHRFVMTLKEHIYDIIPLMILLYYRKTQLQNVKISKKHKC